MIGHKFVAYFAFYNLFYLGVYSLDFIGVCNCDLTKDSCNPNCCCDSDCTFDDRQLFTACDTAYKYEFPHSCTQTAVLYNNFTHYTRNTTSRDLFCVYWDRYRMRNSYTSPPIDSSDESSVANAIDAYDSGLSFSDVTSDLDPGSVRPAKYRTDVPVLVLNINGASGFLTHPRPSNSPSCSYASPALFLDSSVSQCTKQVTNITCETDKTINLLSFVSGFRVARQPDVLKSVSPDHVGNDLVTIKNASIICFDINYTIVTCPEILEPFLKAGICENVLSRLSYNIKFDSVAGIQEVTYKAELRALPVINITVNTSDSSESAAVDSEFNLVLNLTQNFAFNYVFSSSIESAPSPRSGNPGYLLGRPLIARQRLNGTTIQSGPLLTLPAVQPDGTCSNGATGQPVTFGENLRHSCIRRLTWDADNQSIQTDCTRLNEEIKASLAGLGINYDLQVAAWGNLSDSSVQGWLQVHNRSCSGFSAKAATSCIDFILGAKLEILVLKIGSFSNPQMMLTGAMLTCEKGSVLFQCAAGSCQANTSMNFLTTYTVIFTDVTQAPLEGSKQRPKSLVRLPADFFYPLFNRASSTIENKTVGLFSLIFHVVVTWIGWRISEINLTD